MIVDHAALDDFFAKPGGPVDEMLTRAAVAVELAAKRFAPVDTGRLRASISHTVERDAKGPVAFVGSNVNYAIYQELGTRYQPGTPYLRPALHSLRGRL